jgi:2-polyprenyl-3-methyl-5-hydroxy-6-metoxy-1,4-benzoquinol methylase
MKCPICSENNLRLHSKARDYWLTNEEFRLLKCDSCQVVCSDVQTSVEFFEKYYRARYYAHTTEFLEYGLKERLQRDRVRLLRGENVRLMDRIKTRLCAWAVLVKIPPIRNGRILDVGCGAGKLLKVAASVGYECHGVEPSPGAREILEKNGFKAYPLISDVDAPSLYFDVVIFNHSLEHMPDPALAVRKAVEMLKEDGTLIISVPNYDSNERKVFGNYWRHIDVPRHLFHFSPVTLDIIARTSGLSVRKRAFKFWGIPTSSIRLTKKREGLFRAYLLSAVW